MSARTLFILASIAGLAACSGGGNGNAGANGNGSVSAPATGTGASADTTSARSAQEQYPTMQDATVGYSYRAECAADQMVAVEFINRQLQETTDAAERDRLAVAARQYRERVGPMTERARRPAGILSITTTRMQEEIRAHVTRKVAEDALQPLHRSVSRWSNLADHCWNQFPD